MKKQELPVRFFVEPDNSFTNDTIDLNQEDGVIGETKIKYQNELLRVWEVTLKFLKLLRKNKKSFPGLNFKTYAEINDRIQLWQLLETRKKARVAKARKSLREIGERKIFQKRQAPLV
ncbi:hypothetical protein KJ866_04105 [Patescibacteria group bacterium]|nr:hypothetical protein [Patescibacteria group bacterium]MBU2219585.1 hypothetical protein [Patescibacteria group bacterium]